MSIIRRISRLGRTVQLALVAAAAFAVGSATVASATIAGIPIGSLFYIPTLNGTATTPCSTTSTNTTTCNAVVDANGNLHVTGSSAVTGSVAVNNLPSDQRVHGTVDGTVGVNNFPSDQKVNGHVSIDGSVTIGNFPQTQTVHVDNLPATQTVHVDNMAAASGSGGPTLIHLDSREVSGGQYAFWSADVSSCRSVSVALVQQDRNNPDLIVRAVFPGTTYQVDMDVLRRGDFGMVWGYVVQPGTQEAFVSPTIQVVAGGHSSGSGTHIEGDVVCGH